MGSQLARVCSVQGARTIGLTDHALATRPPRIREVFAACTHARSHDPRLHTTVYLGNKNFERSRFRSAAQDPVLVPHWVPNA